MELVRGIDVCNSESVGSPENVNGAMKSAGLLTSDQIQVTRVDSKDEGHGPDSA